MKLYGTTTSPFVRKVRICIRETGLSGRVDEIMIRREDFATTVPTLSPLGKVPVLELDDGERVYDSPVICDALDRMHGRHPLIPVDASRPFVLRNQQLGDGICEAVNAVFSESLRPADKRFPRVVERNVSKVIASFDQIEQRANTLDEDPNVGSIAIAVAVDLVGFRQQTGHLEGRPDLELDGRPKLHRWFQRFADRASMHDTSPTR